MKISWINSIFTNYFICGDAITDLLFNENNSQITNIAVNSENDIYYLANKYLKKILRDSIVMNIIIV